MLKCHSAMKRVQFFSPTSVLQQGKPADDLANSTSHSAPGLSSSHTLLHRLSVELLISNPDLRLVQVLASVLLEALSQHTVGQLQDVSLAESLAMAVTGKRDVVMALLNRDAEGVMGGNRDGYSSMAVNESPMFSRQHRESEASKTDADTNLMFDENEVFYMGEADAGDVDNIDKFNLNGYTDSVDKSLACAWEKQVKCDPAKIFVSNSKTASENYYYACHKCNLTFIRRRHLERHFAEHRSQYQAYLCHTCGKTFTRSGHLNRHSAKHKLPSHLCQLCGKLFSHALHLEVHWRQDHKDYMSSNAIQPASTDSTSESSPYTSTQLNDRAFQKASPSRHASPLDARSSKELPHRFPEVSFPRGKIGEVVHSDSGVMLDDSNEYVQVHSVHHDSNRDFVDIEPSLGDTRPVLTRLLQQQSSEGSNVSRSPKKDRPAPRLAILPAKTMTKSIAKTPQTLLRAANVVKHASRVQMRRSLKLSPARKGYRCQICGHSFDKQALLRRHVRSHSGERPYVCPFCQRAYTRCTSLRSHILSLHDDNRVECKACKKRFPKISKLQDHHCVSTIGGKLRKWYMQTAFLDISMDASTLRDADKSLAGVSSELTGPEGASESKDKVDAADEHGLVLDGSDHHASQDSDRMKGMPQG